MVETIMLILLFGQIYLFLYIGRQFEELKNQLVQKSTIEFRHYLNNLHNTPNKNDRI